jgi:hypothetical protein
MQAILFEITVSSYKDYGDRYKLTTATSSYKTCGGWHSAWLKSSKLLPLHNINAVSTAKWKTFDGKPIPFPTGEDPAHVRLVHENLLE